jgi:integrase/DNA-binding transcriptional regulator YhcF (GntR family)
VARANVGKQRARGSVDKLPSGGYRVRVYAGVDPMTGRDHYLNETVRAGPRANREAEKVRTRLLAEVDERRNPRTNATVAQLLDRHLDMAEIDQTTLDTYRGYVRKHIRPLLGSKKVGLLDADVLDSFYAELRRCREHCARRKEIDHRTREPHDCDERCDPHVCKPLSASTVRQIHFILSGALRRAVRWKWIAANPMADADPPSPPKPSPQPPTAAEAARILKEAWKDPDWGTMVWLTMVTGLRRGELCAIRWRHVNLPSAVLSLEKSISQRGSRTWEKETKTHQQRRITLDQETVRLLVEHRTRCEARAAALGIELSAHAFVFSLAPDGSTYLRPDSVTSRYGLFARRLGLKTSIHKLRHYSATELIAAGVDVRTVAGRLGHGGGGTTTLRVYTAWMSEADQRAAGNMASRMPALPSRHANEPIDFEPTSPYQRLAFELRDRIRGGMLVADLPIPPIKQLAVQHGVSVTTAQRAVQLLSDWGYVEVNTGRRTLVRRLTSADAAAEQVGRSTASRRARAELVDLEIRRLGETVTRLSTVVDPADAGALRKLLGDAVRRDGRGASALGDYEMVVRYSGERGVVATFVATS